MPPICTHHIGGKCCWDFVTLHHNYHIAYGKVRIRRKAQKGTQKEGAVRAETSWCAATVMR